MAIISFTEIKAWQQARLLVADIYRLCLHDSVKKDYGFVDQIRRASVSIMSNIAEGFDSGSPNSFIQFLNYSYRSASEIESLLYVALDAGYMDKPQFEELISKTQVTKKLIGGFIKYLKNNSHKPKTT
ncbi:MAG: four helix bundle protein [Candidatus Cloacimonetes bacterium]|nr:four helix bundle protein [Candidatus Cloacimonadota bacterium]